MTDNRYGDAPLGKSVEEIERESGNLVNPPVEGEAVRNQDSTLVVPAVSNINEPGAPAVLVNPTGLIEPGADAEDGRARSV